jgi:hypothetical protein
MGTLPRTLIKWEIVSGDLWGHYRTSGGYNAAALPEVRLRNVSIYYCPRTKFEKDIAAPSAAARMMRAVARGGSEIFPIRHARQPFLRISGVIQCLKI